jgi:tryptophan-rich sensory protein
VNKKTLAATAASVAATAVTGSRASRTRSAAWYARLRKPAYVPPGGVFPIAWTTLYADIAVTSAAALDRWRAEGDTAKVRGFVAALAVNLALNAGWSWLFFRYHRLGWSATGAGALTASSADLVRRVGEADGRAGVALLPYPLWCAFATVMSTDIWRRNRR